MLNFWIPDINLPAFVNTGLLGGSWHLLWKLNAFNLHLSLMRSNRCSAREDKVYTHKRMVENKTSPCFLDQGNITSLSTKRHKADPSVSMKDRKEKFGERIVDLQQLVSPYGKTDTASVLLEAMEYIHFLHEQVKVLSAPYLQATPPARMQGLDEYSLRSRGLCIVPVCLTAGVASSNGADLWAPTKTKPVSQQH